MRGHDRIFCVEWVVERSPFELSRGDNLWSGLGFLFPWCFVFGDSDHVCLIDVDVVRLNTRT